MAEAKENKLALLKKAKGWKIVFFLIILVAAALLTWVVIVQVKKYKQDQILKDAAQKELDKNTAGSGTGSQNTQNTNLPGPQNTGRPNTNVNTSAATDDLPLKIGSSGANVKALQTLLNQLSGPDKPVTNQRGVFDDQTYKAVLTMAGTTFYPVTLENFQAINKMVADKLHSQAHTR